MANRKSGTFTKKMRGNGKNTSVVVIFCNATNTTSTTASLVLVIVVSLAYLSCSRFSIVFAYGNVIIVDFATDFKFT